MNHDEALNRALREAAERTNVADRDWEELESHESDAGTVYRFQTLVEGEPDPQLRLIAESPRDDAKKCHV